MFVIFSALFAFLALLATYESINLSPARNSYQRFREISELYAEETLIDKINNILEQLASRFAKGMDKEQKRERIEKLRRAGINISYERYVVEKMMYPIIIFLAFFSTSFVFTELFTHIKWGQMIGQILRLIAIALLFAVYWDMDKKIERSLQELKNGIIVEMPSLLSTYRYSPPEKDLIDIFKDFNRNSGYLKYDLSLLITDIDQYGSERALKLFAQRVDVLEVSEAVAIFINDLAGSRQDSRVNLALLEGKFTQIVTNKTKAELKNRPYQLRMLNISAMLLILSMFLMVLGYQVFEGFIKIR